MNYILAGDQYQLIKRQLKKILINELTTLDDLNVINFDYTQSSFEDIESECSMLPLGYEKKAVVIDRISFLEKGGKKEEIEKYTKLFLNSDSQIIIILIERASNLVNSLEIIKHASSEGTLYILKDISPEEWPNYVSRYFKEQGISIEKDALNELALRTNGNLDIFINEAQKLILYCSSITLKDVNLLVSKPLDDDIFQISNSLFKNDKDRALQIFRDLKKISYKATDSLVPLLSSQFRFTSQVLYLKEQGLSSDEIARQLNANLFRVKITLKNSSTLSLDKVNDTLDKLFDLDFKIKSGQIDRYFGIELFLINF